MKARYDVLQKSYSEMDMRLKGTVPIAEHEEVLGRVEQMKANLEAVRSRFCDEPHRL